MTPYPFFTHRCTYLEVQNYVVDQFRNSHFDVRPKHILSFFAVIRNTSQPFHFAAVNFKYLIEILDPGVSFRRSLEIFKRVFPIHVLGEVNALTGDKNHKAIKHMHRLS